ncbi:MAG: hypothetical protein P1V20_25740 [Verrucomicrobiales bacterium]|nr:hypothetical protein [Verrucomicrobiales bacterium]
MAGDWIKMETSLAEKPEVLVISSLLDIDRYAVVGRLHRIWSWFDAHSEDGNAKGLTTRFIDELVFLPGFAEALRKVGWLEVRTGSLSIPRFSRHNGQSAKKRAQARNRQQKARSTLSNIAEAPETQSSCHTGSVTTELPEKRRIEKRRTHHHPAKNDDPALAAAVSGLQSLQPEWNGSLTRSETKAIHLELNAFREYPWDLVRDWLQSQPEKPPSNRLEFIQTGGISSRSRATKWKSSQIDNTTKSDPSWLPADWRQIATEISGTDCSLCPDYLTWCREHPLDRGDFETRCRNLNSL